MKTEGHNPDEYVFEIQTGKGKPAKPTTPSKANRDVESKEENPAEENGNGFDQIDEDELIIKDEIDNFEEVSGDVEKEVRIVDEKIRTLKIIV